MKKHLRELLRRLPDGWTLERVRKGYEVVGPDGQALRDEAGTKVIVSGTAHLRLPRAAEKALRALEERDGG